MKPLITTQLGTLGKAVLKVAGLSTGIGTKAIVKVPKVAKKIVLMVLIAASGGGGGGGGAAGAAG